MGLELELGLVQVQELLQARSLKGMNDDEEHPFFFTIVLTEKRRKGFASQKKGLTSLVQVWSHQNIRGAHVRVDCKPGGKERKVTEGLAQ